MAWVSVHDHIFGGKLRKLSKKLQCSREEAVGILTSLWLWGLNNADKNGRLLEADKDDILNAFDAGSRDRLKSLAIVDVLIETQWIDEPESGEIFIHDWGQWQEQWYKFQSAKEYDARRKREERARRKRDPEPEIPQKSERPLDNPTDSPADNPPDAAPSDEPEKPKSRYSKGFEDFWSAYPRHVDKGNAYKKYMARLNDGYSESELLLAATRYAEQCVRDRTEDRYIKHPKTFLSDALPFLDYLDQIADKPEAAAVDDGGNPFAKYKRGDDS